MKKRINEGGNIFKNADGQPDTIRINRVDVEPTVQWLETITGLELTDYKLGTTGLAPSSGDIDLAVDQEKINKEQLIAKLSGWLRSKNMDPAEYIKKSGVSVHFKTPIQGNPKNGNVQTRKDGYRGGGSSAGASDSGAVSADGATTVAR